MTLAELAQRDRLPLTFTVEEVGKLLGLSRSSAYRAVARGEIPTIRIGRRPLVPTAKLLELVGIELDGHRETEPPTAVTAAVTGLDDDGPAEAISG